MFPSAAANTQDPPLPAPSSGSGTRRRRAWSLPSPGSEPARPHPPIGRTATSDWTLESCQSGTWGRSTRHTRHQSRTASRERHPAGRQSARACRGRESAGCSSPFADRFSRRTHHRAGTRGESHCPLACRTRDLRSRGSPVPCAAPSCRSRPPVALSGRRWRGDRSCAPPTDTAPATPV